MNISYFILTSKEDRVLINVTAGVTVWPQHYRPKYVLLLWVLVTLVIDFGKETLIK